MKFNNKFLYIALGGFLALTGCNKDVLDRPPLTSYIDGDNFWRDENDVRLFANGFLQNYFVGYNSAWGVDYTPVRGYTFSDDLTSNSTQGNFENIIPSSRFATSETVSMMTQYSGPTWNFAWVRKANIFIARLDKYGKERLAEGAYKHWTALARFYRGFEYARLVSVFGDVPYYEQELVDTDLPLLYKDRDDRGIVMDKVYEDFRYALDNIRTEDGKLNINKYTVAAMISRLMLFEGSFQKFHNLDKARAEKYLKMAVEASEIVMNSNKYSFTSDFKSLFSSEDLSTNKEVIYYRVYDQALGVMHHVGSYQNGIETQSTAANLNLIKSFLCYDGYPFDNSSLENAKSFNIANLVKSRDPRFEASFVDKAKTVASSLFYGNKFVSRTGMDLKSSDPNYTKWNSNTNTSDAPVLRLAEVVLNWVEAKQLLAENYGGAALTQADLDKSINALRSRPLDEVALTKGVQKLAPLKLAALPNDPNKDADVSALMWEIRRERRVEFVFEHTRLLDLKRWKKIDYMNFDRNPDYFLGAWVDVKQETPTFLTKSYENVLKVRKESGEIVTYDGTNADDLVGYFVIQSAKNRNQFGQEVYLAPVGQAQIVEYEQKGYKLSQTKNW